MANLVNRLPIRDRHHSTKSVLLLLDPIWQAWIEKHSGGSQSLRLHSKIKSVENNTLTIHCSSASCATLLRHRSGSLLDTLKKEGFTSVDRITIKVEHPTQKNISEEEKGNPTPLSTQVNSGLKNQSLVSRPKVKGADINTLESAAESIENESLSASLKRLANTLRKRS